MAERFTTEVATVATGTDKTLINIFNPAATPTCRPKVFYVSITPPPAAPVAHQASMVFQRTTAVGTEGSGLVPANHDPAGPAGACDSGLGVYSAEPTYTASKVMLRLGVNNSAAVQWQANLGREIRLAATQNNGGGLKSTASSSTQAQGACIMFEE